MIEYKTADTSTVKGIEQAERLKARGWTIYSTGLYLIKFYRRKPDTRKQRDSAMRDLGLIKVKGALGGTYWE